MIQYNPQALSYQVTPRPLDRDTQLKCQLIRDINNLRKALAHQEIDATEFDHFLSQSSDDLARIVSDLMQSYEYRLGRPYIIATPTF